MSDPGGSTAGLLRDVGRRASGSSPRAGGTDRLTPRTSARPAKGAVVTTPTILVAGVVPHLEGLELLGQIQRAGWSVVVRCAARADLVVVGRASAGIDAGAVIAGLKDHPPSAGVPVLHAPPAEAPCAECRADVCLSSGSTSGQLARVTRVLLDLRHPGRGARAGSGLEPRSQQVRSLGAHL